jgi:quercetin dioxygenase-like cupin family protein
MTGSADNLIPAGGGLKLPLLGTMTVTGGQTGGAFEVIEYSGPIQPPPHTHREHDEAFYILNGGFVFAVGQEQVLAGPGDTVLIPRGTRHGFTAEPEAKALFVTVPAGLEGFFVELTAGIAAGRTSQEMRALLSGRYDSIPDEIT